MYHAFISLIVSLVNCIFLFQSSDFSKVENVNFGKLKDSLETPVLKMLWRTDAVFKTPESALFDVERNVIYVSNLNENPREKDGNGFISKVGKDGKNIEVEWVTGLSSPKGMGLLNNLLFVADIDEVVVIDVDKGKITARYNYPDAAMLNDISIDANGTVWMTDMDAGTICFLNKGKIEKWHLGLDRPNGIFVEENRILIASFDGKFTAYDRSSKKATVLGTGIGKGDGIEKTKSGAYLISDWDGEIFWGDEGMVTSILSTEKENVQSADIGLIADENILLVPTFLDNRLVAYTIN
ncbi:SMP-30/gluconolactonase/LRE family protein [Maribacter sp. 2210JD10-5]|uniref:SMP-30/gluconolactonase/LRE family protein n=1 Tax=Maribacter sp. 2210JD10-5 TaxID=3386272 RepID=UPI0039BC961D